MEAGVGKSGTGSVRAGVAGLAVGVGSDGNVGSSRGGAIGIGVAGAVGRGGGAVGSAGSGDACRGGASGIRVSVGRGPAVTCTAGIGTGIGTGGGERMTGRGVGVGSGGGAELRRSVGIQPTVPTESCASVHVRSSTRCSRPVASSTAPSGSTRMRSPAGPGARWKSAPRPSVVTTYAGWRATSAGVGDIAPDDAGAEVHAVNTSRATCAIVARPELFRAGARLVIPP